MRKLLKSALAGAAAGMCLLCAACSAGQGTADATAAPEPTAVQSQSTIMPVSQSASDQLARIVQPLSKYLSEHGLSSAALADIPNEELTNYLFSGILDWQEVYDDRNANAWSGEPLLNVRREALNFDLTPLTDEAQLPENWGNIFNRNPAAPAYALDAAAVAQVMSSVAGRPISVEEIMTGLSAFAGWDGMPELREDTIASPYLVDPAVWNLEYVAEHTDGEWMDVTYEYNLGTQDTQGEMTLHLVPDDQSIFGARVESVALGGAQ